MAQTTKKRHGRICAICKRRRSPSGEESTQGYNTFLLGHGIEGDKAHRECVVLLRGNGHGGRAADDAGRPSLEEIFVWFDEWLEDRLNEREKTIIREVVYCLDRPAEFAQIKGRRPGVGTDYAVEATLGTAEHSVTLSLRYRYRSEEMARRDYAAMNDRRAVVHTRLIRHTPESSKIIASSIATTFREST